MNELIPNEGLELVDLSDAIKALDSGKKIAPESDSHSYYQIINGMLQHVFSNGKRICPYTDAQDGMYFFDCLRKSKTWKIIP